MRNRLGIATALAVVLGLGAASDVRAALDEAAQKSFDGNDVDGDGKVSWEEYRNRMLHVFHQMDHNGDGRLTPDEIPPAKDKSGQPVKGGTVTIEAFSVEIEKAFKKADGDGDGALTPDEWAGASPKSGK
ncbi:MAG: EF-hand domain-containing protein [Candidatus Contendobacter sp.]|nr:EF-hand domain-containing protein [Candidatus Contendobacter sp.]